MTLNTIGMTSAQSSPGPYSAFSANTMMMEVINFTYSTDSFTPISPPLFIPCDNPKNIVSPLVAETVDLVVYVGIFPVLVTCGVITNVINMAVFARQGLSDRIHLCLFSLSVSDTAFLLFLMCGKSYAILGLLDPVMGNYWHQRQNGPVLGSYLAFLAISNTITTIISVERCLGILTPLKAAKIFKTKHMTVGIIVISIYILAVMIVCLTLKFNIVQVNDPLTNTSTYVSRFTSIYLRHRTLIIVLYGYMLSVSLAFISVIVVIVCTTAILIRLKITAAWRRTSASNMTSLEKQEVSVTRMLVTVCCVYIACMTPSVIRSMLLSIGLPDYQISGYLCNTFKVSLALTHMLEAFNASVNFIIYIRQSSRYRSTLRQLCSCLVRLQQQKGGDRS